MVDRHVPTYPDFSVDMGFGKPLFLLRKASQSLYMEDRHSTMPNYWLEMGSCDLFSLSWPQTMILPISNSKAARITGASHKFPDH
jgi:hypothetical protein